MRERARDTGPAYDYMLVVGPGRSGSDFLYENLKGHPDLVFPEIKEGYYYKSPEKLAKLLDEMNLVGQKTLVDISNLAYNDDGLASGVESLKSQGYKVLLVVLLRDHRDRAISMMRFRKSRGEFSALFGSGRLEARVVRDQLRPERLEDIYDLEVDVLVVYFDVLIKNAESAFGALHAICKVANVEYVESGFLNESVKARFLLLSVVGKIVSRGLRKLGFRRTLQRLKDTDLVKRVFFVPLSDGEYDFKLSDENIGLLSKSYSECCSKVERCSNRISDGVYFRGAADATSGESSNRGDVLEFDG